MSTTSTTPKIFRVTFEVSDLDVAATFYEKLLGIPGKRHPGARHYFDCDGVILALLDPSQGAACATAFDDLLGCTGVACDNACPMNDPNQATDIAPCFAAARQGSCMSYTAAEKAACASDLADGGAVGTCAPGTGTNKIDPDLTYIATLICGQ